MRWLQLEIAGRWVRPRCDRSERSHSERLGPELLDEGLRGEDVDAVRGAAGSRLQADQDAAAEAGVVPRELAQPLQVAWASSTTTKGAAAAATSSRRRSGWTR